MSEVVYVVLLGLHVLGMMGWLVSSLVTAVVLLPVLPSLAPQAREALTARLIPRLVMFMIGSALLGGAAGLTLFYYVEHVDLTYSLTPAQLPYLEAGAGLGALSLFLSLVHGLLMARERKRVSGSTPPSGEALTSPRGSHLSVARTLALVALVLLIVTYALMITGANLS